MNRRNFFKSLSGAVVGCYLALDNVKWKNLIDSAPKINPAWVNAEYEVAFAFSEARRNCIPIIFKRAKDGSVPMKDDDNFPGGIIMHDEVPMRLDKDKSTGKLIFRNSEII